LGVSKNASEDEIKKAFRTLAHKYHPDKKTGDEKKFKEVSEAYAVLSDKKKRTEYDNFGRFAGAQGGAGFNGAGFDFSQFQGFGGAGFQGGVEFDMGDIFSEFFGGQGARAQQMRGRDVSIDIELSFRESIFGAERRVLISKVNTCSTCAGSGAKQGSKMKSCATCNGKGLIRETRNTFFGSFTSQRECPTCYGRGQVPEEACPVCRGAGVAKEQEEIRIEVPAGVSDGEMIRMPGRGEAAAGGNAGDLYVKLHVKQDPAFTRQGNDLVTVLKVRLSDVLLGSTHRVHTLDGDESLAVPAGIAHGDYLRIAGKGVPGARGKRGDLLVKIQIDFPKKLSKTARAAVEELRKEGL
ncbi:molecular chaperone DnaJ, partial [Candidatus Kaiserbacteria bacterium]|nr:molecular chaperone DnaJ [Candidatus Kaiserbacteria bacterium]